jgi:hypothetical protein
VNEHVIDTIREIVIGELRDGATSNEQTAARLRDEALKIRDHAAAQAAELETRAADADANAERWDAAALVKRQMIAQATGATVLPTPGMVVQVGELGLAIGALRMMPRADASAEELASFRDLMQAIHAQALHQSELAKGVLRERQATISTGRIAPEDLPQPDPLTAALAAESGGCAAPLRDVGGLGLPEVGMPAAEDEGAGEAPEADEPESKPAPPERHVTAREGVRKILADRRRRKQGERPPVESGDARPVEVFASPVADEPRGPYPSQPAGRVDPLQARLDAAAEAMRDPSARQVVPSSHGADEPTEAFPAVQNGDHRG